MMLNQRSDVFKICISIFLLVLCDATGTTPINPATSTAPTPEDPVKDVTQNQTLVPNSETETNKFPFLGPTNATDAPKREEFLEKKLPLEGKKLISTKESQTLPPQSGNSRESETSSKRDSNTRSLKTDSETFGQSPSKKSTSTVNFGESTTRGAPDAPKAERKHPEDFREGENLEEARNPPQNESFANLNNDILKEKLRNDVVPRNSTSLGSVALGANETIAENAKAPATDAPEGPSKHLEDFDEGVNPDEGRISLANDTSVNYNNAILKNDSPRNSTSPGTRGTNETSVEHSPKEEVEVVRRNATSESLIRLVAAEKISHLTTDEGAKELERNATGREGADKRTSADQKEANDARSVKETPGVENLSTSAPVSIKNDIDETTSLSKKSKFEPPVQKPYPYAKAKNASSSEKPPEESTLENVIENKNQIDKKFITESSNALLDNSIQQLKPMHYKRSGLNVTKSDASKPENGSLPTEAPISATTEAPILLTTKVLLDKNNNNNNNNDIRNGTFPVALDKKLDNEIEVPRDTGADTGKSFDIGNGISESKDTTIKVKDKDGGNFLNATTSGSKRNAVSNGSNPSFFPSAIIPVVANLNLTLNQKRNSTGAAESSSTESSSVGKETSLGDYSKLLASNFNASEQSTEFVLPEKEQGVGQNRNRTTTAATASTATTVAFTESTSEATTTVLYDFVALTESNGKETNANTTTLGPETTTWQRPTEVESEGTTIVVESTTETPNWVTTTVPPLSDETVVTRRPEEATTEGNDVTESLGPETTEQTTLETTVVDDRTNPLLPTNGSGASTQSPELNETTTDASGNATESLLPLTEDVTETRATTVQAEAITRATTVGVVATTMTSEPADNYSNGETPQGRSIQSSTIASVASSTQAVTESTTVEILSTLSPEDIKLLVRIVFEGSWNDVCGYIPVLRQTLADALTRGTEKTVSTRQIIFHKTSCGELTLATSVSPSDVTLTSVLVYVVDEDGKFDSSMTKILPNLHKTSPIPFPLTVHSFLLVKETDSGNAIAVVVVSCVAFICLLLLAGLLFIMRKRQTRFNYGERCRPVSLDAYSLDSVSAYNSVRRKGASRASKRSYGNPTFEDSSAIPSHPLNFAGLSNFCNDENAISEEFSNIPQVTAKIDELPAGAEVKNRYANVIPLPETRVPLQRLNNDPLTEYINANYVRGPKNATKYYIACQAPIESTVNDFWRMIWEHQCKVVIMLTDLVENGIEKCTEYIPPSEVTDCHRLYGDYQVTLKKRETKEKYAISTLHLKNLENNTFREVFHIWYLWPENTIQTDAAGLIAILLEARALQRGGPGPIVVHCSPGTGRTGTLIALDLGIRQYEITRTIDVPRVVYTIRRDRAGSVQTKEQYAFIYKALNLYATKLAGGVLETT